MDMSTTIAPKSDQLNADDLMAGPRTVTIAGVTRGDADQPVNIELAEFPGRAYRPAKSMRRVMVSVWGSDASAYVGHRMTLYREGDVKFGGQTVGGIRISHMSHMDKRVSVLLTATRGRRAPFTVDPLPDGPDVTEFERRIAESATVAELDAVAADLKGCDLGSHRKRLQRLWAERRAAIVGAVLEEVIEDHAEALELMAEDDGPIDRSDEAAELFSADADSEA